MYDDIDVRRRWLRPQEYWERDHEAFSGETVLHDFGTLEDGDRVGARTVLIRFLVAQYLVNLLRGDWPDRLLRTERSAALNAIGNGTLLDRELRSLRRGLQLLNLRFGEPGLTLVAAAAELARERGHPSGSLALCRIVWEVALDQGWFALAARAARGIERLATEGGGVRSRKRWARRAVVLERRAAAA